MKIEIPDNFFPPPGVPLETERQRDLAVILHNTKFLSVQYRSGSEWESSETWDGNTNPSNYRIAPPEPRKVGPFESVHMRDEVKGSAWACAIDAANSHGFKNYRVALTATAEEIL